MRTNIIYTVFIAIIFCNLNLSAQPYTLDKKIKPVKLELKEHPKYEDAKYNEGDYTLNQGTTNYHYVKGHDIYQFVDIFIFANDGNSNLQADLVSNTWNNIHETKQTSSSEKGIINFKVRSYQDIGFSIKSSESKKIAYSIIVNASPPLMNYLGSPFVKASENALDAQNSDHQNTNSSKSNMSLWVYILIGVLLLLVGLLAGKLMSRKETLSLIFLLMLIGLTTESYGQISTEEQERFDNMKNEIDSDRRGVAFERDSRDYINNTIEKVNKTIGTYKKAVGTVKALDKLMKQYSSLESCLGSGPPPGRPRIPSFCVDEENACADCFVDARAKFNRMRYNLEKLQTIYNCSKSYIDAAVAFGDNASGYHGVIGLVWQNERRKIMKSVDDLNRAYDEKRVEMLQSFHESLMALNDCEQEHGMADWYDRFGVMFYNFVEMRYHR